MPSLAIGFYATGTWTIYETTDSSLTWNVQLSQTPSRLTAPISRMVIDPLNASSVFAFVNSLLMRSTDAGATWHTVSFPAAEGNLSQMGPG